MRTMRRILSALMVTVLLAGISGSPASATDFQGSVTVGACKAYGKLSYSSGGQYGQVTGKVWTSDKDCQSVRVRITVDTFPGERRTSWSYDSTWSPTWLSASAGHGGGKPIKAEICAKERRPDNYWRCSTIRWVV